MGAYSSVQAAQFEMERSKHMLLSMDLGMAQMIIPLQAEQYVALAVTYLVERFGILITEAEADYMAVWG